MSDVIPLYPGDHPRQEVRTRPYVAIFAPPNQPMDVQIGQAAGGSMALYPTVHFICEQLGKVGIGDPTLQRRPGGPAFVGPEYRNAKGELEEPLQFSAEHFLLILWFEDGEVEIDDSWCRQLRPPQLFFASFLSWLRAGFTVQREWAAVSMRQAAEGAAQSPGIFVPRQN